jgi:hypothetical protein
LLGQERCRAKKRGPKGMAQRDEHMTRTEG